MMTPDLLEVWVKCRDKANKNNLELKWEENHVAKLYKSGKLIRETQISLGLASIFRDIVK